ncbi:MAG: insulinase family protein [Phycisphaeraceae bacterium]|nr:insulinase family protein [Phycisphaeraceae bacterium]
MVTGCRTVLAMAAAAAVSAPAVAGGPADGCVPPSKAGVAASSSWQDRIVELQAHRRSAVVSAWLENGLRVHHRHMPEPRGRVEVVVCFGGGELLECATTRGLTLLTACYLDAPGSAELSAPEIERLVESRDVRLEGGVAPDGLVLRIWGATRDIESGLAAGAAVFRDPKADPAGVERAAQQARQVVARSRENERVVVADPLRELLSGRGECRAKPACAERVARFAAEDVEQWVRRHGERSPAEVAVVGDVDLEHALRMVAATFGTLPQRTRASHACMKDNRCIGRPQGPLIGETRCGPDAPVEQAHVIAGFLSPNQCDVLEVRKLRAGARVLAERLEAKLHGLGLGGGVPGGVGGTGGAGGARVGSQYLPSPFDGLSVTIITARVAPTDAPAVRQVMQESMCRMLDQGLTADELARATDALAQWVTASEREPRYWSMLLARSTMTGLDPDQLIDGAAMYRAMKPDEVLEAMRRACTPENRVGLLVLPGD